MSPTLNDLPTIGEDEVAATPGAKAKEEEEEVVETRERKRTLTQKFSDMFRRSRSNSKSPSPEKVREGEGERDREKRESIGKREMDLFFTQSLSVKKKKSENPILFEAPPTPPESSPLTTPVTTPTASPPTASPPPIPAPPSVVVSSPSKDSPGFRKRSTRVHGHPGTTPPPGSLSAKKRRGQASLVRPIIAVKDEEDEIAVSERQKQQERFREAQEIQREMSQIELQYEEFEEIAREIEQNLRDAEGSKCSLSLSPSVVRTYWLIVVYGISS